jgi:hypothetical protein
MNMIRHQTFKTFMDYYCTGELLESEAADLMGGDK